MVIAVVPSRFHSCRFPGKPLAIIRGVPLVVRVARRVRQAGVAERVMVATDDSRIARVVADDGFEVRQSTLPCRSGSDRVAGALEGIEADVVLNVQGDEPLVEGHVLRAALAALDGNDLGTVAARPASGLRESPDLVRVQLDESGRATDFARRALEGEPLVHLGIYAFRRGALERFAALPQTVRERTEGLEQLRALEHGMTIGVTVVRAVCASVNRPEDVPLVEAML